MPLFPSTTANRPLRVYAVSQTKSDVRKSSFPWAESREESRGYSSPRPRVGARQMLPCLGLCLTLREAGSLDVKQSEIAIAAQ